MTLLLILHMLEKFCRKLSFYNTLYIITADGQFCLNRTLSLSGGQVKCRPERNEIDLGYRFMKKFWGQGYATEAAFACVQYGFDTLDVKQIIGRALPGN